MIYSAFANRLRNDLVVMYRSRFVAATFIVAIVLIAIVRFVLPGEINPGTRIYVVDAVGGTIAEDIEVVGVGVAEDVGTLEALLAEDPVARGFVFEGSQDNPRLKIYLQGHESESDMRRLRALGHGLWDGLRGTGATPDIVVLRDTGTAPRLNSNAVPLLLGLEVSLVGLFLATVMVFGEKSEGTIRSYRVTPGGVWLYLLSKLAAVSLLTLGYGTLVFVATLGFIPGYLASMGLVLLGGLLFTSLGLLLGSFFEGLSDFMYPMIGVATLLGLPALTYVAPSVSIPGIHLLPSHPLIFGLRETIFPTGRMDMLLSTWTILGVGALIAIFGAKWILGRRLMMEVRR